MGFWIFVGAVIFGTCWKVYWDKRNPRSKNYARWQGTYRCSYCGTKLKYVGTGQWAKTCRKCGRTQ